MIPMYLNLWFYIHINVTFRLEHMKMHEKHRGHESMHAEMILILFATLIFSQIALVKWKQVYPSSYHVSIVAQNIKFKAIVTILLI